MDDQKPASATSSKELRDYAWGYFALTADQRIKTFNFFLVLVTVILAGVLAFTKDAREPALGGIPGGVLLMAIAFVFWKLDCRNREFIDNAKAALLKAESDFPQQEFKLLTEQDTKTKDARTKQGRISFNPNSWLRAHYTYHHCFRAMFLIVAVLGAALALFSWSFPKKRDETAPAAPQQQFFIGTQPVTPNK